MLRRNLFVLAGLTILIFFVARPAAQAATKVGRFAVALENGRIVTYSFDPTTGQLRIIQSATVSGIIAAIPTAESVTVHPNNKFVYVSTDLYSIVGFEIGPTGLLTPLAGSPFPTTNASENFLLTPSGKFGYTENWPDESEAFSVNTTTGALTSLGTVNLGSETSDIAIMPNGKFLYAANNGSSTISGFSIDSSTGALTAVPGSPFAAGPGCATDWTHPSGKFVYCENFDGSISAYSIKSNTGTLTQIAGSPFPGPPYEGNSTMRGTPNGLFLYVGPTAGGVGAFSINQSTGALSVVAGSPFATWSSPVITTADPSSSFLYVANFTTGEAPVLIFAIDPSTGTLTQTGAQGMVGAEGDQLAFTIGAAVNYTPTFAYATNSGISSISELSIASGGLTQITGSPLTDSNGPQASAATLNARLFYTGNSDGSISEYKIESTGALSKIKGSPITGLTNPLGMAVGPFYDVLYVEDPVAGLTFDYSINSTTGALSTYYTGATDGSGPQSVAVDPFGDFTLVVNNGSNEVGIGIPGSGFVGTVGTGMSPVAITIDPSSQFVYVANSGDSTISAYNLTLASPYMTQFGSPVAAGTTPSAVIAEPYGRYLYVANSGSNTISAYGINALTGVLTPISGTFSTANGPTALAVSNDANYLYVTGPTAGEVQQFTINSDGTLTDAGAIGLGSATGASSITTVGTYK